jgi:prepilin-type N-terminal cleavage/methylation domain-containing protein/prepilin-type processing-associated H-X9-DG protein
MRNSRTGGKDRRHGAFTLVELLVVVGIIAVLIGILIPVLTSARKTAQAAKCASALREIGNAFKLYAIDNNQYYPPLRCVGSTTNNTYQVMMGGTMYNPVPAAQTYWMYFLARYISKGKFGANSGATAQDAAQTMATVLWGCPTFVPVNVAQNSSIGVGGIAVVYTGYGMNGFPEYTATYPPPTWGDKYDALGDSLTPGPPNDLKAVSTIAPGPTSGGTDYSHPYSGKWYKMGNYTKPAERALVGDCRAYVLEALKSTGPNNFSGQASILALQSVFWTANTQGPADTGQSSYDYYRHGKYPGMEYANAFSAKGGKISYNVLFADGHVSNLQSREEGFAAARMRFPG